MPTQAPSPGLLASRSTSPALALGCSALVVVVATVLAGHPAGADEAERAFDAESVQAILVGKCLSCHDAVAKKGGLDLSRRQGALTGGDSGIEAIVPGDPELSFLFERVADGDMPPGNPLPPEQVESLRAWIADGAEYPSEVLRPLRAGLDWWSIQLLADAPPPMPEGLPDAWTPNPIDRFIFDRMAQEGLEPSPPADRRALLRRVTFDLTGLPPTPEEVEAFLHDEAPDAYEKVVERLLASPHYGERWGRHWLDVVRFGESNGFERNVIIDNAWPFRDYVIRSLNDDKPFDQLVLEHLAGDALGPGDPEVEVGTTFLVCGPYDDVGNQDPVQAAQIRADTIDDMIRAVSETFLGVTVGCARCHDHKFDPIATRDYYALYATFASTHHGSREVASPAMRRESEAKRAPLVEERDRLANQRAELEEQVFARAQERAEDFEAGWSRPPSDRYGTEESFSPVEAKYVRLVVLSRDDNPDLRTGFHIDEFEVWTAEDAPRNVALAAHGGTADGPSRVAEDFAEAYSPRLTIDGQFDARWIAAGSELTITLARPETIDRVVFSSDREQALGPRSPYTHFVGDYRIEVSLDGDAWTEVASSSDRRPHSEAHQRRLLIEHAIAPEERDRRAAIDAERARVDQELAAIEPLPSWWVGQFREAEGPFHVFEGGDPQKPGEPVVPASPTMLDAVATTYQLPEDASEQERRLALARWLVAPDNPLTPRVLANRLWHYHFGMGIVETPSDFGFMGGRPSHPELLDWLAHQVHEHGWRLKPLHRLIVTSQTYRQASAYRAEAATIDAESRLLWRFPPRRLSAEEIRDAMLAVSGVLDTSMGGPGFRLYRYLEDNVATYVPRDEYGPETYRRAVYHQNARASHLDLMTDFDCPDNAFAAPRRASTTSPLQALTLMNHRFTLDMAGALADRLEREAVSSQPEDQVQRAFLLAFARPPAPEELAAAARVIEQHGARAFCRALFNANEFLFLD